MDNEGRLEIKGRRMGNRVDSSELESQPGTWVEFRASLKLKHLRAVAEMATFGSVDWATDQAGALDAFARIGEVLSELVLAWNWRDDLGEPLEQPRGNPGIFEELTFDELQWLMMHLGASVGAGSNPKARKPPSS